MGRASSTTGTATRRSIPAAPRHYGWDEAKAMVLESFAALAPEVRRHGRRPSSPSPGSTRGRGAGKQSGAYSHPVTADRHPYVFLNYMGERRDVLTLAHELGHAVHQTLAAPLGTLLADTPLTLAETASIFGEGLVFERLLAEAVARPSAAGCWPARSRTGSTPWSARSPSTASRPASTPRAPAGELSRRADRRASGWR